MERMLYVVCSLIAFNSLLLTFVSAQLAPDPRWLKPNGSNADFSETYINGDTITFRWKALNDSVSDLWLTSFDTATNSFARILQAKIDISTKGDYQWTLDLKAATINEGERFTLRFVPKNVAYYALQVDQFASPGFIIQKRPSDDSAASVSAPTETATSTATISIIANSTDVVTTSPSTTESQTTSTSDPIQSTTTFESLSTTTAVVGISVISSITSVATSTSISTPSPQSSPVGLSTSAVAGIVIGSAIAVGMLILVGWFIGRGRRKKMDSRVADEKLISPRPTTGYSTGEEFDTDAGLNRYNSTAKSPVGTFEAVGSNRQPVEMDVRNSRHEWHELE